MTCADCGYMMGPFDKECPRCRISPSTRTSNPVSMPTASPVISLGIALILCPACQQMVSTQATNCPHCGQPMTIQSPTPQSDRAILANGYSNSIVTKSRISPLIIAVSIICAILFVIGLVQVFVGCTGYANRFSPITVARNDMSNLTIRGGYISPIEYKGNMSIAEMKSQEIRVASLILIGIGCAFAAPMLVLVIVSFARRGRRVAVS